MTPSAPSAGPRAESAASFWRRTLLASPTLVGRLAVGRRRLRAWGVSPALWAEARHQVRAWGLPLGRLPSGPTTDAYKAAVLYALCRARVPALVVETGVASGNSSLGILSALAANRRGRLYSVDLPEASYRRDSGTVWSDPMRGRPTGWRVPDALRDRWTLRRGPSREILPSLMAEVGPIDLFYHDSEHTRDNMAFEIGLAWAALRPGGILAVDNADWSAAFPEFLTAERPASTVLFPYLGLARKPAR